MQSIRYCAAAAAWVLVLTAGGQSAKAIPPHPYRVAGWGWESYSLSSAFSYGGYWGAHYGGARGILSGAAPHYGNYGGWYARHYVIGTAPWPAWDHDRNLTWDERYSPSPWNFDGVSHLITHPREDVNYYVPRGAGPYVPPNLAIPDGAAHP